MLCAGGSAEREKVSLAVKFELSLFLWGGEKVSQPFFASFDSALAVYAEFSLSECPR